MRISVPVFMLRCCCGSQASDDDEQLKTRPDERAVFVSRVHPELEARARPEVLVLQSGIVRKRLVLQHVSPRVDGSEIPRVPSEERSGLGPESSDATQSRGDLEPTYGSVLLRLSSCALLHTVDLIFGRIFTYLTLLQHLSSPFVSTRPHPLVAYSVGGNYVNE